MDNPTAIKEPFEFIKQLSTLDVGGSVFLPCQDYVSAQSSWAALHFIRKLVGDPAKGKHTAVLLQEQNATVAKTSNGSHSARHVAKAKVPVAIETALPEASSVMEISHRAFTAMSSQMAALESRMAEVQQQSASALSKQKAQYEAKLKVQRADAHATELVNARTTSEIDALRQSSAELRKKADKLAQAAINSTPISKACRLTSRQQQSLSTRHWRLRRTCFRMQGNLKYSPSLPSRMPTRRNFRLTSSI